MNNKFDVLCVGNAIVDVIAQCSDDFLSSNNLQKGSMRLISAEESTTLYGQIKNPTQCSGGSAANTAAGISSFGGRASFIGRTQNDAIGKLFADDLGSTGVKYFPALSGNSSLPTATSIILVTEDGERTMNTCLGISPEIHESDITDELIKSARMIYIEGYLWDMETTKQSIRKALTIANNNDISVALTLSDSFCVKRHYNEFHDLIKNHIDILFANEAELLALCETEEAENAAAKIQGKCKLVLVTRGEKGCSIIHNNVVSHVPTKQLQPVDTTGAGDLFAAGFLYGYSNGINVEKCVQLGHHAASEIIMQYGARPKTPLKKFAA